VEQNRLNYLKLNQASLRTDLYNGVSGAIHTEDSTQVGRRIILPFSFAGGPRHMLPIVPRASRAEVVSASLRRSSLWRHMKVMKLSINMRLRQTNDAHENQRQKNFADFLLQVGDGKYPVIPM